MITLKELIYSTTAVRENLSNEPTSIYVYKNLCDLLTILNCVRAEYGQPIKVTSGYRCPTLNFKVGGVKNSGHLYGLAADVQPFTKNNADYLAISKLFITFAKQLGYNSIVIFEKPKNGIPSWLHLEISKNKPSKIFTLQ